MVYYSRGIPEGIRGTKGEETTQEGLDQEEGQTQGEQNVQDHGPIVGQAQEEGEEKGERNRKPGDEAGAVPVAKGVMDNAAAEAAVSKARARLESLQEKEKQK